ncbi:unnamed protein product, partial [Ascophyllum nodosum]
NAELFALRYGVIVVQLIQDFEDYESYTKGTLKRGYNIGVRLIDEFLANSNVSTPGACADLREAADVIAKVRQK